MSRKCSKNVDFDILLVGLAPGVHFYTLNKDAATTSILTSLGLLTEVARPLPFQVTGDQRRSASGRGEVTRPVYWAHRPRSFVHRTRHWEKYPRGR